MSTSINNLANEIAKQLEIYTKDVEEELQIAQKEVTKEAVKELRSVKKPYRTGKYAKSWTSKKQGGKYIIHNKKHYRLTHLLEYGHAKVGGGRVPAYPHIAKVEEKVIRDFTNRVERAIRQ